MARDRATILTGIWGNPDIRALPPMQQWLYMQMWTHPDLNYCGVLDWRPGRLAQLSAGSTADSIRAIVPLLVEGRFAVLDEESEEILLRPYLRHDGLLKQPKLAVSMANAYASTGSTMLRGVIVHELSKLRREFPDLAAWKSQHVLSILDHPALDPATLGMPQPLDLPIDESNALPLPLPLEAGSPVPLRTTTATTTATSVPSELSGERASRATTIPKPFVVTTAMRDWAADRVPLVNVDRSTEMFVNYWRAKAGKDATKRDWPATWRNWLLKDQERAEATPGAKPTKSQRARNVVEMAKRMDGLGLPEVSA